MDGVNRIKLGEEVFDLFEYGLARYIIKRRLDSPRNLKEGDQVSLIKYDQSVLYGKVDKIIIGTSKKILDKILLDDVCSDKRFVEEKFKAKKYNKYIRVIPRSDTLKENLKGSIIRSYSYYSKESILVFVQLKDFFYKLPKDTDQYEINLNFF